MKKKKFTLANYYNEKTNLTELSLDIDKRFREALEPVFTDLLKKGHNYFVLEQIATCAVHEMILHDWSSPKKAKPAKPAKKSTKKKTKKKASK